MEEMKRKLEEYAKAYEAGKPLITDAEFDKLHTEYKKKGGEPITMVSNGTIKHETPMSSMSDTFTMEDALKKLTRSPYKDYSYIVEPKWDGVSGSFTYRSGELIRGLTRGDGTRGELIRYHHEILNLPQTIPTVNDVTIRGELIIAREHFDYEKNSNPRNSVAGAIRTTKEGTIKKLKIVFIPWDVIFEGIEAHSQIHDWLEMNGFETNSRPGVKLEEYFNNLVENRNQIPYDMDGVVIKIDNKKTANRLGMGSKYSNYMFALKFKDEEHQTEVVDVAWQMGMNGTFTPVSKLKPVEVNGVTITSVTLHNLEQMEQAKAGIGSKIKIIRSGDVIPKYIGTIKESDNFNKPKECPHCKTLLTVAMLGSDKDSVRQLYCPNDNCAEKTILKLVHFTKRGYLDIKGLSRESIDKLYYQGHLRSYTDLFKLSEKTLVGVLGKNGEKIYHRIQNTKGISIQLLLGSVPMPNGGRSVWKKISRDMTYREMIAVDGIGEETAASVTQYLGTHKAMIDELIKLAEPTEAVTATTTFGISGKIPGGRPALIKKLEAIGWRKTSGKADYFIAGEGAVMKKAKGKVIKVEEIPWPT